MILTKTKSKENEKLKKNAIGKKQDKKVKSEMGSNFLVIPSM